MKTRSLKGVYTISSLLLAFLSLIFIPGFAQKSMNIPSLQNEDSKPYIEGAIHIKVKENKGPFVKQSGTVSFGIASLDQLVQDYGISHLSKRFTHKPIAKNSKLPDISRIYLIEFPAEIDVWKVSSAFHNDPNIEYAEPIPKHQVTVVPDDPMYGTLQHLPQIMAEEAWEIHKGEEGSEEIIVAIVDTGIEWDHEDLQDNVWQNMGEDADGDGQTMEFIDGSWELDPGDLNGIDDDGNGFDDDLIGWNFILGNSDLNPIPTNPVGDHGTHCAGISNGVTNNGTGIASISWNLKVMGICADANNSLVYGYDGIVYAAENGADFISNSWSGSSPSQVSQDVINYATGLGSVVLAAAGNHNSLELHYPASYANVISVASVSEDDTKASYSAYNFAVDVSAPGGGNEGGITSTVLNNGYANKSGTSMATPLVAGLFGLLKSYHPDWSNEELLTQLLGTADDIDAINPGYENYLGSGRINAFHALTEENVVPPQLLKIDFLYSSMTDENGNSMLEPGEEVTISATFRNFSQLLGSDEVTFTLITDDPDISITTASFTTSVPPDGEFEVEDAFVFEIGQDAETHVANIFIEVTADVPVVTGSGFQMDLIIAPTGMLVWEGEVNDPAYSGHFIAQFLEEQGYDVLHTNVYPHSFIGFDATFLSFGNGGEEAEAATLFEYRHTLPIKDYLIQGGSLYLDGMAIMSIPDIFDFPNALVLWNLFGVANATIDFSSNPISSLEGQEDTPGEGMVFTESNQFNNWYIDIIQPSASATTPFFEDNYGFVSLANAGNLDQKTFYLGYNLADLVDVDPVSSRYNVLVRVMEHLGYPTGDDFVVANFSVDHNEVLPEEEIQFLDFSIAAEGTNITSWQWDFNEDGTFDATDQNPVWTYGQGGNYDITLIVSNGIKTDTLVRKNHILVKSGIFVFEGAENGTDQSGGFIRDYLLDNGYETVYSNAVPTSLDGFEAVFASFGSAYYKSPVLDDNTANVISTYLTSGGKMYLEGANALGVDQAGNNALWFRFGLELTEGGQMNMLELLQGQEGSIMDGIVFSGSTQTDYNAIDNYQPYSTPEAIPAFEEDDYGVVALQFDGTEFYGQKTFCMSYSLANLEDGDFPNTRAEILQRVLNFFDVTTSQPENRAPENNLVEVFPIPANDRIEVKIDAEETGLTGFEIIDMLGNRVHYHSVNLQKGRTVRFRIVVNDFNPGLYFYRMDSGSKIQAGKLIISR